MASPLDRPSLIAAIDEGLSFRYRFFWGPRSSNEDGITDSCFSQWWSSRFEIDGQTYTSAEQWMMASKALLFGDDITLAAILKAEDPAKIQKLGRRVKGFEESRWVAARYDLVTCGNIAKFEQNHALRKHLEGTEEDVLVEASPFDCIWGIGSSRDAQDAMDPKAWRGLNLLGFALMRTRAILRGELPAPHLPLLLPSRQGRTQA